MSPKSEREDTVASLASKIFSAMLEDIVLDAAIQSHHEVIRSRAICHVCNTRCGMAHVPVPSTSNFQPPLPPSRSSTPLGDPKVGNGSLATGTSTPTSVKADGINYLECVNCNRVISSNRYAPHLSSCLGISRRGPARATYSKPKNSSDGGRSLSPSENGTLSDDARNIKEKGKSKSKRADDAEFYLKRKRPESPQVSPGKKAKRQKASGSPVARVKTETDISVVSSTLKSTPSNSHLKIPSKLRSSSTASFFDYERSSSPASRSSSPATPVASIPTPNSSAISAQSPILTNGGKHKSQKTKAKPFSNPPPRPRSPPRPPPPQISMPEPPYLIDVEADETGSSTDTDAS